MKKIIIIFCLFLCACNHQVFYQCISMDQAMEQMKQEKDYIILDVRTIEEYNQGHIPHAICIPVDEIEQKAELILSNKNICIFVYCRSGNRSQQASKKLSEMGYVDIYEIGGILDWKGELEYS
ncbi:rhodanese-like domain-containing protein [Floccifex sp.]|uniref:rhodanese-like domain-containing protein n=1 Tax=Floccifex sp. TaxID=2815810 RepID=UPI003F0376F1